MKNSQWNFVLVCFLSLLLYVFRLMPHQANLTPVLALCLVSGFIAKGRWYSMALPLMALAISDWQIGFYPGWAFNYISLVLVMFSGVFMSLKFRSFMGFSLLGAVVFFLASNFGVWMFTGLYTKNFEGLMMTYQMGIPFFKMTLASTLFYGVVFFGACLGLQKLQPGVIVERA